MSELKVDIMGRVGRFSLEARFIAGSGVTALFGPSGAGKSSILRAVAGLWQPQSGSIQMGDTVLYDAEAGHHVRASERNLGLVFQEPRLFPHMNVRANLLYAKRNRPGQLDAIVDMLDLGGLLDRSPKTLSGGEAQRVAIGRVLLSNPRLLMLDEPMTGLDEARRQQVFPYLKNLRDEANVPILYVSHRREEVALLADRIVAVDAGKALPSVKNQRQDV